MENQKSGNLQEYQQKLNEVINQSNLNKLDDFFRHSDCKINQKQFTYQNSFLGRVQRNIVIVKKKILQILHQNKQQLQEKQIRQFKNKMISLTHSTRSIIRDGIISLYSQLSEIRQQSNLNQQKIHFVELLNTCLQTLQPILKDHFIYKQIQKIQTKNSSHSLHDILSQKRIQLSSQSLTSINQIHSIKQLITDRALAEIAKIIQNKSIQQLINQQLKGQENQIQQVMETCRICKNSYKLKSLARHIKYCKKIQDFNCRRQILIQNQLQIIEKIKKLIDDNNKYSVQKQPILRLYKKILQSFEQTPKLYRRTSVINTKNRKRQLKRLSTQINEFLCEQDDQILNNFKNYTRQRQMVEKKISSLQNNYLHSNHQNHQNVRSQKTSENSQKSYRKTIKSLKTSKLVSMNTKKSLFAVNAKQSPLQSENQFKNSIHKNKSIKGHMDQILDSSNSEQFQQKYRLCKSMTNFLRQNQYKQQKISVEDFQIIKFLGKGAFGKVYLVRRKKTKDIYALKVIKIQQNWGPKQLDSIANQHQILSKIGGQHLVKAPFSFTEGAAHFFVLQYMPGGDLGKVIQQQVYLDFKQAQFYLAQIVLAIERLHQLGIIHRDLKPQNLIFDENGHLKLTDFGLSQIRINDKIRRAKRLNSKTEQTEKMKSQEQNHEKKDKQKSALLENKKKVKIIGTPDYIAPQILSQQSLDNLSIDWWSLGVIAYEMMIGCRPFCANTVDEVIKNIQEHNIQWPQIGQQDDMINPLAADLIKKLLNPNYKQRLGSNDISQIKNHPFFSQIDWQQIKSTKPPLTPIIDPKQNYQYSQQVSSLKLQILTSMGNAKIKSSFKLDNFVRYDILMQQTLESADKQIVKREARIKKLKSIASNFGNESVSNKNSNQQEKQVFFDEEIQQCWVNFQNT